ARSQSGIRSSARSGGHAARLASVLTFVVILTAATAGIANADTVNVAAYRSRLRDARMALLQARVATDAQRPAFVERARTTLSQTTAVQPTAPSRQRRAHPDDRRHRTARRHSRDPRARRPRANPARGRAARRARRGGGQRCRAACRRGAGGAFRRSARRAPCVLPLRDPDPRRTPDGPLRAVSHRPRAPRASLVAA